MQPDFGREVHCLLGLIFDAVDMTQAEQRLLRALTLGERCFLSTPNLNFLIACRKEADFRNSVLKSDLCVADGMPLVWLSHLLGIPIRERVAGSDLFDRLARSSKELRIFFFGGTEGVAEKACESLNSSALPACCVGFHSPGFGSVADMSSDAIVTKINASGANFVVVALGAKKGQEWIELNRHRLDAPLVSHLGAVVNFVAGTVARAPRIFRRLGLEWLWRIKEEPQLWRRYFNDGVAFANLLLTRILPLAWLYCVDKPTAKEIAEATIETRRDQGDFTIRLTGAWKATNLVPMRKCFVEAAGTQGNILLDMAGVSHIDSAALGLLLLLHGDRVEKGKRVVITATSPKVKRIIRYSEAGFLVGFQGGAYVSDGASI